MAYTPRRTTKPITATAGPIDETEEEKRKKRGQGGRSQTQQAPWRTPSNTATTSGGGGSNPFSASVYARPGQTMQGPAVASVSARPKRRDERDLWSQLTNIVGSTPSSPGGSGTGGMFMPTVAMGKPPAAAAAPAGGGGGGGGGISLGGGPGPGMNLPPGLAGALPPGLGNIPLSPGKPATPAGGIGSILGAMTGNPSGQSGFKPAQPKPRVRGGGSRGKPPGQLGSQPIEAPEPGDFLPTMPKGPIPPVASMLPPPQVQMPPPPQATQGPPPGYGGSIPASAYAPSTGSQYNGSGYQPSNQPSSGGGPPGTQYRWGPNGYGYYPI